MQVNDGKIRAIHSDEYVRLKFYHGSYAFTQIGSPMKVKNSADVRSATADGVIVVMTPEECLDLITMLQSHYQWLEKKYEFGYGMDTE